MFIKLKRLFAGSAEPLEEVIQRGAIIVDVRTKDEYNDGHLEGSQNIPLAEIKLKSHIIKNWSKPVVTVCRSGNRSSVAKEQMERMGIEAYNGGAWTSLQKKLK